MQVHVQDRPKKKHILLERKMLQHLSTKMKAEIYVCLLHCVYSHTVGVGKSGTINNQVLYSGTSAQRFFLQKK
jgi:hypothetical protein